MIAFLWTVDILENVQRWEKRVEALGHKEVLGATVCCGELGREVVEEKVAQGLSQAV